MSGYACDDFPIDSGQAFLLRRLMLYISRMVRQAKGKTSTEVCMQLREFKVSDGQSQNGTEVWHTPTHLNVLNMNSHAVPYDLLSSRCTNPGDPLSPSAIDPERLLAEAAWRLDGVLMRGSKAKKRLLDRAFVVETKAIEKIAPTAVHVCGYSRQT